MKSGMFRSKTNSADWTNANGTHNSEKDLEYDYNENILSLNRTDSYGVLRDELSYEYQGNKIVGFMDANQSGSGYFQNGLAKKAVTGNPEYDYDQNVTNGEL